MKESPEYKYLREHFEELLAKYDGKVIIIRQGKIAGVFKKPVDAYKFVKENYTDEKYVIKEMSPDALKPVKLPLRAGIPI